MNPSVLMWILATAVPEVTAGPNLAEAARVVDAPLAEVTVFSDRAKMLREAVLELKPGMHTLRLPDLPGAVLLDTVRLSCTQGRVLRLEVTPVERERFSIDQVEELIVKLEALTDQLAALDAEAGSVQQEVDFLSGVAPVNPVPEAKRMGQPLPVVTPEMWRPVLDFLASRREADRARLRTLAVERRGLEEKLIALQRELQRFDLGAFTDRKVQVIAILEVAQAGNPRLELEYFLPGASWKPTYDIHFSPESGAVGFNTAGMVRQATGEDWKDVDIRLSTAIPGQGIDVPELLTWALGEKREFIPQAYAARMPAAPPRFPPPSAQATASDADRLAKLELLRQRLDQLRSLTAMDLTRTPSGSFGVGMIGQGSGGAGMAGLASTGKRTGTRTTTYQFDDVGVEGDLVRPEGQILAYPKPAAPPSPPAPRRPMKTKLAEKKSLERGRRESRPAPASAPMPEEAPARVLAVDREDSEGEVALAGSTGGGDSGVRTVTTPLSLFEPSFYSSPSFGDPALPAVVAGGLDYVYSCPTRVSVPSNGQELRVPLSVESYPVKAFYEATPSLMTTAFLKASVVNKSDRPILMGPANIFVGKDFTGQGVLKTTGPGGQIEFPLGADENVRLLRKVVPSTETKGIISKDEVTTYRVTIEVGNYKKQAIRIALTDQIPKTNNEDIEVKLGATTPKPVKGPDADGLLRWELDLPAGKTQKLEFSYSITRPTDWQLTQ